MSLPQPENVTDVTFVEECFTPRKCELPLPASKVRLPSTRLIFFEPNKSSFNSAAEYQISAFAVYFAPLECDLSRPSQRRGDNESGSPGRQTGLTSQLRPSLSRLRKNVNTEALCFMDYLLLQNYGGRNPTLACHVASVLFNVRDHSPKQHRLKLEAVFRLCFSSSPPTLLSPPL